MPKSEPNLALIGGRIRGMREGMGLGLNEAARLMGASRTYLGRLERGQAEPGILFLARTAALLGCPLSELVEGVKERVPGWEDEPDQPLLPGFEEAKPVSSETRKDGP